MRYIVLFSALLGLVASSALSIAPSQPADAIGAFCKRNGPANYGLYTLSNPDVLLEGEFQESSMCIASARGGAFCRRHGPANYGLYALSNPDVLLELSLIHISEPTRPY